MLGNEPLVIFLDELPPYVEDDDAEVEQIDAANGNNDASEAARLVLIASLSTTPGGHSWSA